MGIIDTYWDAEGAAGNALYITTLDSGDSKHVFSKESLTVTIPTFPGLTLASPLEIMPANADYLAWLHAIAARQDIQVDTTSYVPAVSRIVSRANRVNVDYTITGLPKLLDAEYTSGVLTLQPHSGGEVTFGGALQWAKHIKHFLTLSLEVELRNA